MCVVFVTDHLGKMFVIKGQTFSLYSDLNLTSLALISDLYILFQLFFLTAF